MGKVKGRSEIATEELKNLAILFAESHMPERVILEHLNTLDMVGEKPLTLKGLRRWGITIFKEVDKAELVRLTYRDVLFLRDRAYEATAMCEINRYMYITERAYWWGLYISALHIMLRQAMAVDAAAELPPQFIMDNLDKFYADIRAVQQMTPPLDTGKGEETVEQLNARMKAFEDRYAKDLKLPKETL